MSDQKNTAKVIKAFAVLGQLSGRSTSLINNEYFTEDIQNIILEMTTNQQQNEIVNGFETLGKKLSEAKLVNCAIDIDHFDIGLEFLDMHVKNTEMNEYCTANIDLEEI